MISYAPVIAVADRHGMPLARAALTHFAGNTETPLVVFHDAARTSPHPQTITADLAGRFPVVYLPIATAAVPGYRVRCLDAEGFVVFEASGIALPAAASSTPVFTYALPVTPVRADGGALALTVTGATFSGLLSVNATADVQTILPPLADVREGASLTVRQTGSGGAAVLQCADPATLIDGFRGFPLAELGETVTVVAAAAEYKILNWSHARPDRIVRKRLAIPPPGAISGDWYIATATSSPWVAGRLYRADGTGGWRELIPALGWSAVVLDETVNGLPVPYRFTGAWVKQPGYDGAALGAMELRVELASGTKGGVPVLGAWTRTDLNVVALDGIDGAALAAGAVTLPAGTYTVRIERGIGDVALAAVRLHSPSSLVTVRGLNARIGGARRIEATYVATPEIRVDLAYGGTADTDGSLSLAGAGHATLTASGTLVLTTADTFELQYYAVAAGAVTDTGLGAPLGIAGEAEVYAVVTINRVA